MKEPTYFMWDWKCQPDWEGIDEVISEMKDPRIYEVNTQMDSYAIVISDGEINNPTQVWEELWGAEDTVEVSVEEDFVEEAPGVFVMKDLRGEERPTGRKLNGNGKPTPWWWEMGLL